MAKRLDPKEVAGMMNLAMQENPHFRGNQKQMCEFFATTAGVRIENIWAYLKDSFVETGKAAGRTIYGFKPMESNPKRPEPIHYTVISNALKARHEYVKQHPTTPKEVIKKEPAFAETPSKELTEQECIEFLKSKGYRILKPVTEFKEV